MPRAEFGGFPTYWTRFGQGLRAALMIHCSLASSRAWGPLSGVIGGALDMVAYDLPGHGRSAAWDAETRDFQDVSVAIGQELMPEGPVDLIGHSFGATVALRLARAQPARVRSLTLIEPVFFAAAFADDPQVQSGYEQLSAPFVAAWQSGDRRAAAETFLKVWGDGAAWDDLDESRRQIFADRIHIIIAEETSIHTDPHGLLQEGALSDIRCPTLLIEGGESPAVIGSIHEALARRLPDARRVVIAGAGHMVPITHADQVGAEILSVLRETSDSIPAQT